MTTLADSTTSTEQGEQATTTNYEFGNGYGIVRLDETYYNSYYGNYYEPINIEPDVAPADITVTRGRREVCLSLNGGADQLIIDKSYFTKEAFEAESDLITINFADGTAWSWEEVTALAVVAPGTDGDDDIYGNAGDNILDGGAGDDTLGGLDGNDTYIFASGYGYDTIEETATDVSSFDTVVMAGGISPDQITVTRSKYAVKLALNGGADMLEMDDWFYDLGYQIEEIQFTDPAQTVWTAAYLDSFFETPHGTEFEDELAGTRGNDVMYGYGGRDYMEGMLGNDVVDSGAGDDYILERLGRDLLHAGTGDDMIDTARDAKVVTYNLGDGWDSVTADYYRANAPVTISLGGGITVNQLALSGFPLEPEVGVGNITWGRLYIGDEGGIDLGFLNVLPERVVDTTLQIIGDDIRIYDLDGIIADLRSFGDSERWYFAEVLDRHLLSASTDAAIGGALAYEYAINGNIDGLSREVVQATLAHADFAVKAQSITGGAIDLSGDNLLTGTAGADTLDGQAGNDTLDGLGGNDILIGGSGNDLYLFGAGYGEDQVQEDDATAGNLDTLRLGAGVDADDVLLYRDAANLYLGIGGTSDLLTIKDWFANPANRVEHIEFADGSIWTESVLAAATTAIYATSSSKSVQGGRGDDVMIGRDVADVMTGKNGDDALNGGGGGDSLDGGVGDDRLNGGAGDDNLVGGAGADILNGGTGNDTLAGGVGHDIFRFGRGDGQDLVTDAGHRFADADAVQFGAGIDVDQLWFRHVGNDLQVRVLGGDDVLTVQNWYAARAERVAAFHTADGATLAFDSVEQLVTAMSGYDVALIGQSVPAELLELVTQTWQ